MDDRRFDAWVRSLAAGSSRRQMLKGMLGLGSAAAAGHVLEGEAARRPAPTPKPVRCPGQQTWTGSACVCPGGTTGCGSDCCPDESATCCDNACCYGECYGEEVCCPNGRLVCEGQCTDWECCTDADCPGSTCTQEHTCGCVPACDGLTCGDDDGCGGTCECPDGWLCLDGLCFALCDTAECGCSQTNVGSGCLCISGGYVANCTPGGCPAGWACTVGFCISPCGSNAG